MLIQAIVNQKGGVGKSTLSTNIAFGIAKRKHRVLLIDLDPQAHSTVIYCDPHAPATMSEVLLEKRFDIRQAIYPARMGETIVENLFVLPSNIRLATAAEQIAPRVHREKILARQLEKIAKEYDYAFIDCPPTLGVLAINGIFAAEHFLIPVTYSRYALDGVADLFEVIREVKERDKFYFRIVRNALDARNRQTNQFINSQLTPFANNLAKTIIRKTEAINQAQINGEPIFTFDANGKGVADFESLIKEIVDG